MTRPQVEEFEVVAGALTVFSGIPFDNRNNPWSYEEAKRLLKLLMEELRNRRVLRTKLGVNLQGKGRPAITGRDGTAVWDFLPVYAAKGSQVFTQYPHLTIAIERDRVLLIITIPHGVRSEFRRNLVSLGEEGFRDTVGQVTQGMKAMFQRDVGAKPWVIVVQRRYPSQRAAAIYDARIEFDPRTAVPVRNDRTRIRDQPQWLDATFAALARKRSNLQVAVGAIFPYDRSKSVHTADLVDRLVEAAVACRPLLDAAGVMTSQMARRAMR